MTIFINGKQKQVRRPETIDGLDAYDFMLQNADPIWLHQNGMWEHISEESNAPQTAPAGRTNVDAS